MNDITFLFSNNVGSLANVGSKFPEFSKKAVVSLEKGKEFETITNDIHTGSNKWMVIYFYPKDFTFVCPTEIVEFDNHFSDFRDRDTVLIGASTDSEFVHQAWRTHEPKLTGLKHALLLPSRFLKIWAFFWKVRKYVIELLL